MDKKDFYKTSDFALAISLYCHGFALEAVDKQNLSRCEFIFDRSPDLDRFVDLFWKRNIAVEPQAFWSASKALKSLLYDR